MFPSHIEHWVDENKTDIPRISLAFNIKIAWHLSQNTI
jgi:hypothetical protein